MACSGSPMLGEECALAAIEPLAEQFGLQEDHWQVTSLTWMSSPGFTDSRNGYLMSC